MAIVAMQGNILASDGACQGARNAHTRVLEGIMSVLLSASGLFAVHSS